MHFHPVLLPRDNSWVNVLVPISQNVREAWKFTHGLKSTWAELDFLHSKLSLDKNDEKQAFQTPV